MRKLGPVSRHFLLGFLLLLLASVAPTNSKLRSSSGLNSHMSKSRISRFEDKLADRYLTMLEYTKREPLINFVSPQEFKDYIVRQPRNYSVLVLFNSEHTECRTCLRLHDLLENIALEYNEQFKFRGYRPLFFVELLNSDVRKVFDWLKVKRIPDLMLFSEHGQLSNVTMFDSDHYDIRNSEHVLKWLRVVTKDVVSDDGRSEEEEWATWINVLALLSVISTAVYHRDMVLSAVTDMTSMAYFFMLTLSILTGGHIFNYIETPQFVGQDHEGGFVFFARSMSYQLQSEAFIITVVYSSVSLGCLGIIEGRRLVMKGNEEGIYLSGMSFVATALGFFSLIACSAIKMGG